MCLKSNWCGKKRLSGHASVLHYIALDCKLDYIKFILLPVLEKRVIDLHYISG